MKKVLISLMTVTLVSLMVVGGAFAAFSDTEKSPGNTITAGTLDLVVNGENPLQSTLVTLDNMCPGDYREVTVNLTNEGSQPGDAWMMFTELLCSTGAYVEPEVAAEGGTPIDDLCSKIVISVNGEKMGTLAELEDVVIPLGLLDANGNAGAGMDIVLGFLLMDDTGNEYQGDVCEFTLVFGLDQTVPE
jgi:predicted ribosomally synthesized peptide with SipW-like signal peptide